MSERFRNKYRVGSARLKLWDYSWNTAYFITICTRERVCFFGEVLNGKMILNDLGKYADTYWRTIPEHFPFIKLKNHIVMPNHVHGILVIDNPNNKSVSPIERQKFNRDQSNMRNGKYEIDREVDSRLIANLPPDDSTNLRGGITRNHNPMLHENLSRVLRWYKGRTTFECRKLSPNFGWQARFYDHIIRNEESFHRISQYISNNPLKWSEDRYS